MSAFELLGDPSAAACEGDSCALPEAPRQSEAPAEDDVSPADA